MRGAFLAVVALIICLLALIGGWEAVHYSLKYWHRSETPSEIQNGTFAKFGTPIAHQIVGPFHILVNRGYISGYDGGIQDPRWVETRFFSVSSPVSVGRPKEFSPDPRIEPEDRVNTHYWSDSGYDRGHMAPNWGVSICYGRTAQIETFLLTNVIPQTPALNRGLWETLEKIISNDYAERFGEVWVICGPVFPKETTTLSNGKICVPDRCYKIILRIRGDGVPQTLTFEMPQNLPMGHDQRDLLQYLTSVEQVERDTGITFFPDLPAPDRSNLEHEKAITMW